VKQISIILSLTLLVACSHKNLRTAYDHSHFDQQVINKLPLYDSLVTVLIQHYPTPAQFNYDKNAYRYIPSEDGNDLYKVFPREVGNKIKEQITDLGTDFIYGFDCYKDTTIKIMLKSIYQKDHVDVIERLSYFPAGMNIKHREYPMKDTILNPHWQYWIALEEHF